MTVEEFEAQKATLACRLCGTTGLVSVHIVNNNGIMPGCPACGCSTPLLGVQYLRQNTKKRRPAGKYDTTAIWQAHGDRCAFCGKTREMCASLHIGVTVGHVPPYRYSGHEAALIPYCARCQEESTARQRETADLETYGDTPDWLSVLQRIKEKQARLDDERAANA